MTSMFLKGEKICYKMVYYTLCIGSANRQKSCWKVRIYVDEKPKGGLALIGLGLMFIIKNTHKLNKVVKT